MLEPIKKWLAYLYLHYELITCIYMFEPWERKLINGMVILIGGLITYSTFMYLPNYTETLLHFLSPAPNVDGNDIPVTRQAKMLPIS